MVPVRAAGFQLTGSEEQGLRAGITAFVGLTHLPVLPSNRDRPVP